MITFLYIVLATIGFYVFAIGIVLFMCRNYTPHTPNEDDEQFEYLRKHSNRKSDG